MSDIIIQNLSFRHEADYPLIDNFSYNFGSNKHYAIIGPSGCGKTTLLHLIAGLTVPHDGSCEYKNQESSPKRQRFAYIFTRPFLIRELSIYDNITMGLRAEEVCAELLHSLLALFDIASYLNYFPDQLSSGQQQRVAVIRALMRDSDFVLADEPAAHLDFERGTVLMQQMQYVLRQQKRGLICVTHQHQWLHFFDNVIELSRGNGGAIASPA